MGRTRTRSGARASRSAHALAVLALAGSAAWGAARYAAGPPPAHTGGFGEPTCHRCHFGAEPNEPPGTLTLLGVPKTCGGRTYRITLRLERPDLRRAGFQMSARFAEGPRAGAQAGSWRPLDDRVQITRVDSTGIDYVHHTHAGSEPTASETTAWTLEWTAPETSAPVVVHVAANAANDDDSEFGDRIYTARRHSCTAAREEAMMPWTK